ncbi:UvrD-helicase domain-containing protein [Lactobacillus delbrueckii subsp. bulgaricus]|nr:DNA helicase UvrD [Lactobacillus delbrueckii subsp. bulgaricus]
MPEAKVAIATSFLNSYSRLPKAIQHKVESFMLKFQNDPANPGTKLEKIRQALDDKIYSARIDEAYRGIIAHAENAYLILWVDHHDEAYEWARRKKCQVNTITGSIQVYSVEEQTVSIPKVGIFNQVADKDLCKMGVPKDQLAYVKKFTSKDDFYLAKDSFAEDTFEYLSWLTQGYSVQEVFELIQESQDPMFTSVDTFDDALETSQTQKSFVVVDGQDELRQIMAAPLEKWRVFLHPTQRKLVKKKFNGPARVLGGAGTGKTVVAMHRAKFLAKHAEANERILFTTFTTNLAQDIQDNLRKICTVNELHHIDVVNLDAWVSNYLKEQGYNSKIVYGSEVDQLWDKAMDDAEEYVDYPRAFYKEEWVKVVEANEAFTLKEYARVSRTGRGTRLNRKARMKIWKIFEAYMNEMTSTQQHDVNYAMYELEKILSTRLGASPYSHLIVDEGQDLSQNAYRLLRALMGPEHENDIFIVGDAHQRIYDNRASLSSCGINIRGRSSILKINYRTTEEIRQYAVALLNGLSFDDLDNNTIQDEECESLTHGKAPVIKEFKDETQEVDFITREIDKLHTTGIELKDICLVARTNKLAGDYQADLTKRGLKVLGLKSNQPDDRTKEGVRVATMHRVKGLEFEYMFIAAVNERVLPLYSAISDTDEVAKQDSLTAEKCLFYVALTRARQGAFVTSYGSKSEFLK